MTTVAIDRHFAEPISPTIPIAGRSRQLIMAPTIPIDKLFCLHMYRADDTYQYVGTVSLRLA